MPGCSPSLRQIRSSFAVCASCRGLPVVGEIRRRVSHVAVEQQLVKLVGQIVVVGDDRPISSSGVQSAGQPCLSRGDFGLRADRSQQHCAPRGGDPGRRRYLPLWLRAGQPPGPPQTVGQIAVDVDVPGDGARARPSSPGRQSNRRRARRECTTSTGPSRDPVSLPSRRGSAPATRGRWQLAVGPPGGLRRAPRSRVRPARIRRGSSAATC